MNEITPNSTATRNLLEQAQRGDRDAFEQLFSRHEAYLHLTLHGHASAVRAVAFSADGTRIASASNDGTVRVWDAATGDALLTLRGHNSWVLTVAFSPDGRRLASAGADQTVRLWDVATGHEALTLRAIPRMSLAWRSARTAGWWRLRAMTGRSRSGTAGRWSRSEPRHMTRLRR